MDDTVPLIRDQNQLFARSPSPADFGSRNNDGGGRLNMTNGTDQQRDFDFENQ